MDKEFEFIDHTADVGIRAYGADVKEAFANAARGLFSLITELDDIEEVEYRDTELTSSDQEDLLVEWLNELIYLFDAENIIFKRFDIINLDELRLRANVYGEKFDPLRHELKTQIKAATYHMLKIEKGDGFRAQIIFDA